MNVFATLPPRAARAALACLVCALAAFAQAGPSVAGVSRPASPTGRATPPAPQPSAVVVLDTTGFWRMHNQLRPPLLDQEGGPKPILYGQPWLDRDTGAAPAAWRTLEFDDSEWLRGPALRACRTPYLSRLCLRGRFEVTDPTKVKGLAISLGFHGGAAVYVNGTEIERDHLPGDRLAGPVTEETLANYPDEAFVTTEGDLLGRGKNSPEAARRTALRDRQIEAKPIPSSVLRKGTNVLAIEILRAPYPKLHEEKRAGGSGKGQYMLMWSTCELLRVQLTAEIADGLVPNAVRPAGLQAWNSDLCNSDFDLDWGDRNEPLRPVKIVGSRNGTFCGKFVVGCDKPIQGLAVTAGELKGDGGAAIPASAVRIRYALPWGSEYMTIPYTGQPNPYPKSPQLLSVLSETAPREANVSRRAPGPQQGCAQTPRQPEPVYGAVVPIWVSVSVPAGAKPGRYAGQVRVEAAGEKPITAAVELTVADWSLPNTEDYKTWTELIESPDTPAMEYGLELWSEKHWKMIEQGFRYCGQTGSRVVHVPLLAQTNLGHEQSMVRWIRKPAGKDGAEGQAQHEQDYTILDRYLDAAEKYMGKPKLVVFWVWDIYLLEKEVNQGKDHLILEQAIAARDAMRGTGPRVTVLDPASGKVETAALPPYKDPASKALWRPVMDKVREKMKARGLEKAMLLGMINDATPSKAEAEFFAALWPGVPWAMHAHHPSLGGPGGLHGVAQIGYRAAVWNVAFSATKSMYGWKGPSLLAYYDRDRDLDGQPPVLWSHLAEVSITGSQRGVGRLGADYWRVVKDKAGQRRGFIWERYPQSSWRNLDLCNYVMGPGPDGPAALAAFEYLREGVQHCEARIFLEQALTDKARREKLGEELAAKCQAALDERQWAFAKGLAPHVTSDSSNRTTLTWRGWEPVAGNTWFTGSGWQERSRALYTLAGEAERKLK